MRFARIALAGAIGAGVVSTGATTTQAAPAGADQHVIIIAEPGRLDEAEQAVTALGGTVGRTLSIIGGFAGVIADNQISGLVSSEAVASVSLDATVTPTAVDPSLGYDSAETSSLSAITRITGAQAMWSAGYAGKGVDVAVIDTGVTRVPGLDRAGKVIDGPDLSFDSIEPTLVSRDAFGHGTHMAGIIAGSDVAPGTSSKGCVTCLGKSAYTDTTKFVGVAPEARIINVKVGAYDGATDVSQVIAAIDWVVQHRNDPGSKIRVLNLSFGTDSVQAASLDPLVHAAEVAWKSGIVVVAAAGNDGLLTSSLANPAISPTIIAVGASDPRGTLTTADDIIPSFAQHGNLTRGVDVVAPGVSVIGLRVPGSFVDQYVTTGNLGARFQMTLVDPTWLYAKQVNSWYSGNGAANVAGAVALPKLPAATAPTPTGTGLGSLEAARGSAYVSIDSNTLTGERDIFGSPWVATKMAASTAAMLELKKMSTFSQLRPLSVR